MPGRLDKASAKTLWDAGETLAEIASGYGVSPQYVHRVVGKRAPIDWQGVEVADATRDCRVLATFYSASALDNDLGAGDGSKRVFIVDRKTPMGRIAEIAAASFLAEMANRKQGVADMALVVHVETDRRKRRYSVDLAFKPTVLNIEEII